MSEEVKTTAVVKVLGDLGFNKKQAGSHMFFSHKNGTVVTVPARESLRPITFKATARQIANGGITTENDFVRAVNRASEDAVFRIAPTSNLPKGTKMRLSVKKR